MNGHIVFCCIGKRTLLAYFIWNYLLTHYLRNKIQSVPPIWKHIQTHFSIFQNHICQKVTPDLKFLGKKVFFGNWHFFLYSFKTTSNLNFLGFKVPSKSFFPKNFKSGVIFWHLWFFNFQNLVRNCQHIGGTPCI